MVASDLPPVNTVELEAVVARFKEHATAGKRAEEEEERKRERRRGEAGGSSAEEDEDSAVCGICYSSAIDTTLLPCRHLSCHTCIIRHLLNHQRCFFCNSPVAQLAGGGVVIDVGGGGNG